jgi:aryl-alcohol dehydrogenase-like predicted oxidoreductase
MPEESIPEALRAVVPARRRLAALAADAGMSLGELALRFMLTLDETTCLVIGVETVDQVKDNLRLFGRGPLPADVMAAVDCAVPELPAEILTPSLWPNALRIAPSSVSS